MLRLVWSKLIETAIVVGGFSVAMILGVSISWSFDSRPLFVEALNPAEHFVETPVVQPGAYIITHRTLRRTDDCPNVAGAWVLDTSGKLLMPLKEYLSIGEPKDALSVTRVMFWLPEQMPVGKYQIQTSLTCQRNPLNLVTQTLRPLPFEVVGPETAPK